MTRHHKSSKHSGPSQTVCPACGRSALPPAQELVMVKLRAEKARLAQLESQTRDWPPKYLAYEDLPPPSPEDRQRFIGRLLELTDRIEAGRPVPDYAAYPETGWPPADAGGAAEAETL
ncbi:hypothetical protein [Robiginitomaculum antarcticum]|uniref:hypothetical protein n=1 Tax=Robiginitomaculum antarcticum TaxID=437507 RepID=UPI0012EA3A7D|nr:hypothetical protein [Robiginitomaculum antarcticum]